MLEEKEENNLTASVSNEILNTSIDLSTEYSELALDEFLADGILKEVPIIKTIYSVGKLGVSIRERFFVKKLCIFLKEFHSETLDESKLDDFKYKFDTDTKYRKHVTEHLVVCIDALQDINKPKILAKLFRACCYGKFDWDHFVQLSIVLNNINPKGLIFLEKAADYNFQHPIDATKLEDLDILGNIEILSLFRSTGIFLIQIMRMQILLSLNSEEIYAISG
jgi:hypothetical protein